MTDPTTPATVARADERRRLHAAGIEDDSLVDHIIDDLVQLGLVRYEPLAGHYWTDDLPDVIRHVAQVTLARASAEVIAKGWPRAHGRKDFRHGLYEGSQIVKEVQL